MTLAPRHPTTAKKRVTSKKRSDDKTIKTKEAPVDS